METILLIILAVILPPAAVAIKRGAGTHLVISIILTLLAWVPGILHALYVIFADKSTRPATA